MGAEGGKGDISREGKKPFSSNLEAVQWGPSSDFSPTIHPQPGF